MSPLQERYRTAGELSEQGMDHPPAQTFGQLVRFYRLQVEKVTGKRLTIEALAEACQVSRGTIKYWESDRAKLPPKTEYVERLADVFTRLLGWDTATRQAFIDAGRPGARARAVTDPATPGRPVRVVPRPRPRAVPTRPSGESAAHVGAPTAASAAAPPIGASALPSVPIRGMRWGGWRRRGAGVAIPVVALLACGVAVLVAWLARATPAHRPEPASRPAPTVSARVRSTLPVPYPGYTVGVARAASCAPFGCAVARVQILKYFQWNGHQVFGLDPSPHCTYIAGADVAVDITTCSAHSADAAHWHEYSVLVYVVTRGVRSGAPEVGTHFVQIDYYADGHTTASEGAPAQ